MRTSACAGLLFVSLAASAARANVDCSGNIAFLGSDNSGAIYVDIGYGVWSICSVSSPSTQNGTTVGQDACKAWYSALLAAQRAGTPISIYMYGSTACGTYGNWVSPGPYFVQPQ
jgi:hypothetical protein